MVAGAAALVLSACVPEAVPFDLPSLTGLPAMPWDDRPEAATWTNATLLAVRGQDEVLAARVPSDVAALCPGYERGSMADRRAFWTALIALTAEKESKFNPGVVAQGRYVGLMQISTRTADHAGCSVSSKDDLKDGENNLFCAVQLMAGQVAADGQAVGAKGNRGIGRDWMPWRKAAMRAEAADWLKSQSYCR